jgi:hypothetical protein
MERFQTVDRRKIKMKHTNINKIVVKNMDSDDIDLKKI